jgi:hypothetical protein
MKNHQLILSVLWSGLAAGVATAAQNLTLNNGELAADFDDAGLARVTLLEAGQQVEFGGDSATLTVNGDKLAAPGLKRAATTRRKESIIYTYAAGDRQLQVIYELKPGWRFVSKQLALTLPAGSTSRVDTVEMFRAGIKTPVA